MSILILFTTFVAGAEPVSDPISPAKGGMLQCYSPDDARKTCKSLAGYKAQSDQSYINDATVLLMPEPLVTMRTSAPVRAKGNAICGVTTRDEITTARLFLDGEPIPNDRAGPIKARIAGAMAAYLGKEICTTYTPGDGGLLIAKATVAGVLRPELQQDVRWVRPEDGYTVAP